VSGFKQHAGRYLTTWVNWFSNYNRESFPKLPVNWFSNSHMKRFAISHKCDYAQNK